VDWRCPALERLPRTVSLFTHCPRVVDVGLTAVLHSSDGGYLRFAVTCSVPSLFPITTGWTLTRPRHHYHAPPPWIGFRACFTPTPLRLDSVTYRCHRFAVRTHTDVPHADNTTTPSAFAFHTAIRTFHLACHRLPPRRLALRSFLPGWLPTPFTYHTTHAYRYPDTAVGFVWFIFYIRSPPPANTPLGAAGRTPAPPWADALPTPHYPRIWFAIPPAAPTTLTTRVVCSELPQAWVIHTGLPPAFAFCRLVWAAGWNRRRKPLPNDTH